jgi:tRNA1(Val) A37 N6-methylase TrmN6
MHEPTPAEHETLDPLVGDWQVLQLRRGHRFSVDDIVCAWRAAAALPQARRLLDIGCGIGSVGTSTLWKLGHADATLVGVEAQQISVDLNRRSVRLNGLEDRITVVHGDLRDPDVIPERLRPAGGFELITGSPPYIPEGKGVMSPIPQRAGARMELRGSVFDYCEAARRWLAPGGRFAFVMAAADERTEAAPPAHGLRVVERLDVTFRAGREPHIAVLVCARVEDVADDVSRRTHSLTLRDADGELTPENLEFRQAMGAAGSGAVARRRGRSDG